MTRRCLIMAGGTGGHVFPGLAVADALRSEGWHIEWLGTADRMEAQVVPAHGYPIHFIPVRGIRGKGLVAKINGLWAMLKSFFAARRLIRKLEPVFVIGMGGYASGPGGIAARTLGIPLLIHEQNAAAGMTNRLLAKVSQRVLLGFAAAQTQFAGHANVVVVGNPVRKAIAALPERVQTRAPLRMLVVGGSLGAQSLNQTLPPIAGQFAELSIWHQCGAGNGESVSAAYADAAAEVKVTEFIDNMADAYQWADFIVCRAGALTVAEVAAAGLAAVFVPLPHAVDDHQTKNAQALVDCGGALIIPQPQLAEKVESVIKQFIDNPSSCVAMGQKARSTALTHATQAVVEQCHAVLQEVA